MDFVPLGRKGSISIEFILIVGIALIYINGVVWPIAENSSQTAIDITAVADTKIAAMKIANAIDEAVISSGDMKKTIQIFVPENAEIVCSTTTAEVKYSILVDYMQGWNPDEEHCIGEPAGTPTSFKCESAVATMQKLDTCPSSMIEGPLFREIVIRKEDTGLLTEGISLKWAT